jgi:hypothetical protein
MAFGAFPLATYRNQLRRWQPVIRAASSAEISSARIVFGNCVFIFGTSVFRSERRSVALSVRVCGPLTRRCSDTSSPQASQFSETCIARPQNRLFTVNHNEDWASAGVETITP